MTIDILPERTLNPIHLKHSSNPLPSSNNFHSVGLSNLFVFYFPRWSSICIVMSHKKGSEQTLRSSTYNLDFLPWSLSCCCTHKHLPVQPTCVLSWEMQNLQTVIGACLRKHPEAAFSKEPGNNPVGSTSRLARWFQRSQQSI